MRPLSKNFRERRAELLWTLAGLVILQLAIGLGIDQFGQSARDPEFDSLLRRLSARCAEEPGRPLVLALGSSRTQMALHPARLNQGSREDQPLVFNFAIPGSGPMMDLVTLRRLLAEQVRPQLLVVEAMPMGLSHRQGTPIEENFLDSARLGAKEAIRLHRYYNNGYKLWARWLLARFLPTYRHQAELRDLLALDQEALSHPGANEFRYGGVPVVPMPVQFGEQTTHLVLTQYDRALTDNRLAQGPAKAWSDLLELCRLEGIPVAVLLPPEAAVFRAAGAGQAPLVAYLRQTAAQVGAPLIDARRWVEDRGFRDGIHASIIGAEQFTDRFGREVVSWREDSLRSPSRSRDRPGAVSFTAP